MSLLRRKPKGPPTRDALRDAMRKNVKLYEVEGYWRWSWKGPEGFLTQPTASGVERSRSEACRQIESLLTPLGVEIFREVYP